MTDKILGFVFAETTITPADTVRGLKLAYGSPAGCMGHTRSPRSHAGRPLVGRSA